MKYLIRRIKNERSDLISFFSTSVISIVVSFCLLVTFANLLNQHDLGSYQYLVAFISIIGSFSLTGAHQAIVRAVSNKNFTAVAQLFKASFYSSLFSVVIAIVISVYYFYAGNNTLAVGILGGAIAYASLTYLTRYNAFYLGLQEFKLSNHIQKVKVLTPLLFLPPVLYFFPNPELLTIIYFGGPAVGIFIFLSIIGNKDRIKQITDLQNIEIETSQEMSFAIHQSILNIINVVTAHIDKVIIFQLLGGPATAIYYIATSIPDRIRDLIKQFEPYLFAKFSNQTNLSSFSGIKSKFWFIVLASACLYLTYIFFAPIIYNFILPQYKDTLNLSIIYGLTIMAGAAIVPYSALKAHGSNNVFYYYTIVQSIIKISAIVIGGLLSGILGVIIGATVASLTNTMILLLISIYLRTRHTASIL